MYKNWFAFVYILFSTGLSIAQTPSAMRIAYDCSHSDILTPPVQEAYRDPVGAERELRFQKNPKCYVWLRYDVTVASPQKWVFQIQYPTLDWAEVWIDGTSMGAQGGDLPISSRQNPTHLPTWIMNLASGNHRIELASIDTMGSRRIPHLLMPDDDFINVTEERTFIDGIVLGMAFLHCLIAIILIFIKGHARGQLYYSGVVLSVTLYITVVCGYAFPMFWPEHPAINSFIGLQTALFCTAFLSLWALRFQNSEYFLPKWNTITNTLAILLLVCGCILPLSMLPVIGLPIRWLRQHGVFDVIALSTMLSTLLITGFLLLKRSNRESTILILGLFPPIVAIMLAFAHDRNLINLTYSARIHIEQASTLVMFTWLSGALALLLHQRMRNASRMEIALSASIVQNMDSEHERIARELHDDIGQRLVALQYLFYGQSQSPLSDEIRSIIASLRHIAHGLHPALLINGKLGDALEIFSKEYSDKGICKFQLELEDSSANIQGAHALHLHRIIQECTTNALNHGKAHLIGIHSQKTGVHYVFHIWNDGLAMPVNREEGMGLTNIRARLRVMNGSLEILSHTQDHSGPSFFLTIPV